MDRHGSLAVEAVPDPTERIEHCFAGSVIASDRCLKFAVDLMQIHEIDVIAETYTAEIDLFFRWKDPRLENMSSKILIPKSSRLYDDLHQTAKTHAGGIVQGLFKESVIIEKDAFGREVAVTRPFVRLDHADGTSSWELIDEYLAKEEPMLKDWKHYGTIFAGDDDKYINVVKITTLVDEPKVLLQHRRLTNGETGEITQYVKVLVQLKERLELQRFPFDRQLLRFKISLNVPDSMLCLRTDDDWRKSTCQVKDFGDYRLDKHENAHKLLKLKTFQGRAGKSYSGWKVRVHVERVPRQYIINIVVLLYVVVSASFCIYLIPLDDVSGRLSNAVAFILTTMALKWIVSDQLPKKSYQTAVDVYLLFAHIVQACSALELLVFDLAVCVLPLSLPDTSPAIIDRKSVV